MASLLNHFIRSGQPSRRSRLAVAVTVLTATGALLVPTVTAAASPPPSGGVAVTTLSQSSVLAARPVLRQGSRGSAVVTLQRRLATLRYDVGPADGVFGAQTHHAVVAFQKVNLLGRDGIVGPRTWAALDNPRTFKPEYRHTGYAVEVDISRQVLVVTRGGGVVRIVNASTGTSSTPTPRGNYTVQRRINGWRDAPLGLLWRPNYFRGGYAVHGSTSVPTYPASHGCVRVTVSAMNRLWSIMGVGTPVHIYR